MRNSLDLQELIVKHPASTFFIRAEGDAMREERIESGDLLVVDRSVTPREGHIVLAIVSGEFAIKRLGKKGAQMDLEVWGVVTYVIHRAH